MLSIDQNAVNVELVRRAADLEHRLTVLETEVVRLCVHVATERPPSQLRHSIESFGASVDDWNVNGRIKRYVNQYLELADPEGAVRQDGGLPHIDRLAKAGTLNSADASQGRGGAFWRRPAFLRLVIAVASLGVLVFLATLAFAVMVQP